MNLKKIKFVVDMLKDEELPLGIKAYEFDYKGAYTYDYCVDFWEYICLLFMPEQIKEIKEMNSLDLKEIIIYRIFDLDFDLRIKFCKITKEQVNNMYDAHTAMKSFYDDCVKFIDEQNKEKYALIALKKSEISPKIKLITSEIQQYEMQINNINNDLKLYKKNTENRLEEIKTSIRMLKDEIENVPAYQEFLVKINLLHTSRNELELNLEKQKDEIGNKIKNINQIIFTKQSNLKKLQVKMKQFEDTEKRLKEGIYIDKEDILEINEEYEYKGA